MFRKIGQTDAITYVRAVVAGLAAAGGGLPALPIFLYNNPPRNGFDLSPVRHPHHFPQSWAQTLHTQRSSRRRLDTGDIRPAGDGV